MCCDVVFCLMQLTSLTLMCVGEEEEGDDFEWEEYESEESDADDELQPLNNKDVNDGHEEIDLNTFDVETFLNV